MAKRVFVSADWKDADDHRSCDREVVDVIRKWTEDGRYAVSFDCTDDVHNSVTEDPDCRRCEIKGECGRRINCSSVVIVVIGDNTATKNSGECESLSCSPAYSRQSKKECKYRRNPSPAENKNENGVVDGNKMSYLEFEITKAALAKKSVILVFNSMRIETNWVPTWYNTLKVNELCRVPFWKDAGHTKDCYQDIKEYLQ